MDKRWMRRRPVRLNVVIHATGNRLISGRVRDLSPGGMYVEIDHDVELAQDGIIRVGFMLNNEMQIAQARVIHREAEGFGFRFVEASAAMRTAMEDLFREEDRAATAVPVHELRSGAPEQTARPA